MAPVSRLFQLSGTCNNYPWGKKGKESLAAQLCKKTPGTSFTIDDNQYYSEMWFGDYPDFPARDLETGTPLEDLIKQNKEVLLGSETDQKFDGHLPFLPKILSFDKALPLQIHPNKTLAAELHAQDPDNFTDTNHKPEISVALSKFELFIGWKPLDSISPLFKIPSLRPFVPDGVDKWTDETLRSVVKNILKADELIIKRVEKELFLHLSKGGDSEPLLSSEMQDQIFKLLPRLQDQYTATDPGSLVALLCMNYLVLERGDSVFIPADGIHAYLSGDIVECMARSNNMLAAGLCPAADRNSIDLFAKTLTFSTETKDFSLPAKSTSDGVNGHTTVYQPPISEFDMLRTILASNEEERLRSHNGPKVAIVVSGSGKVSGDGKDLEAKEGFIFYVAPGIETVWTAESEMEIFTAVVRTTGT